MLDANVKKLALQTYWSKDLEQLRALISKYPQIIAATEFMFGGTLLHVAAGTGSLPTVKMLIEEGFDVNAKGSLDGDTPLSRAASTGNLELINFLLDQHAILQTEKSIQNPLFGAICAYTSPDNRDHPKERFNPIVQALLDAGIDATVRYNTDTMLDMDAMSFACMWGRQDLARIIAEHLYGDDEAAIETALADAAIRGKRSADRQAAKAAAQAMLE